MTSAPPSWQRPALSAFALLVVGGLVLAGAGVRVTHQTHHLYLVANLGLALIPLGLAWLAARLDRLGSPRAALVTGLLWLLFLPNAPYILTDFTHLRYTFIPWAWAHLVLLVWFSFTGLLAGLLSLRLIHLRLELRLSPLLAWTLIVAITALCGVGVAIGRIYRWHSVDLFLHPKAVLGAALRQIPVGSSPLDAALPVGISLFFTFAYVFLHALTPGTPETEAKKGKSEK